MKHTAFQGVLLLVPFVGCASGGRDLPEPPALPAEAFLEGSEAPGALGATEARVETPSVQPVPAGPGTPAQAETREAESAVADDLGDLGPRPVGSVAGQPVTAEDLLLEWNDISSRELWLVTERLVTSRLALAEAQRMNIRLEPAEVEKRVESERRELRAEIVRRGLEIEEEDFIRRQLKLEPKRYIARLRRATIHQLLAERAVRASSLSTESVMVRLIVVEDQASMQEVQAALDSGADFAEMAQRYSIDESAKEGGLVPFVVWQEHAPLARLAFRTKEGEVGGPLDTADHLFLVKVETFRPALEGDWQTLRVPVERSLADFPVSDGEFLSWKLAIEERYPVDLSALVELLGTAR